MNKKQQNQSRSNASKKAARTVRARRDFVEQFGEDTLHALATIVTNNPLFATSARRRSLAAYKANLTRGAYSNFVRVSASGQVTSDRLGLDRLRS